MSDESKLAPIGFEIVGQIERGDYWEWRTTIEEMQHSETKLKNSRLLFSLMEKDIEIQKLRGTLFKEHIRDAENAVADRKKDYELIKKRLEEKLGCSLNNSLIDDVTFEVKRENSSK